MECILLCVGKTDHKGLGELIQTYQKRLGHYTKFSLLTIDDIKNSKHLSEAEQKQREGKPYKNTLKPETALSCWTKEEKVLPPRLCRMDQQTATVWGKTFGFYRGGTMVFPKNSITLAPKNGCLP